MYKIKLIFSIFYVFYSPLSNASQLTLKAKQAILIDAKSSAILYEKNARDKMFPSSMTKIMTALICFEAIKAKQISLTDSFYVSENAWRQKGSRMFIEPRDKISVDLLLQGLLVSSGNDASIALAEGIAGSHELFVNYMNRKVESLGLKNTFYERQWIT